MHRTPTRTGSIVLASLAACALLALGGCAATAATEPSASPTASDAAGDAPVTTTELGTLPEPLPVGEVLGQGLVLDAGVPVLCLGPVAESAPPQCGGIRLAGWDWTAVDGWDQRSSTRWGSFAVQGTWDGETLAVTGDPISLALYDPAPIATTPPAPGTTDPAELDRIAGVLREACGDRLVDAMPIDGTLTATVVFDDGTLQEHVDGVYGPGVVRITSALQEVQVP